MKPNKNNKRRRIKRLDTPPSAIIVGVLLGIGTAVSLYMFQYAMFEALRMTSLVNQLDFVFLSDIVRQRNNLYMAGFAAVFGHSVALAYLLKVGYSGQVKQRYLLRMTIHDQRSLSWYTLLWMTSFLWLLSILLFSVFGMATINIPNAFFNFLVVLALVVLLFHSYIGLRRLFRSNMYRWMLVSTLSILLVGLTLSRWHPINTKANDELVKKAYPILQYPLEYPVVRSGKRLDKKSWHHFVFVQQNIATGSLVLTVDDHEIDLNEIAQYLVVKQNEHQREIRPYLTTVLCADKNIPMFQIDLVIDEVLKSSSAFVAFAVNDSIHSSKNPRFVYPIKYPRGPLTGLKLDSHNIDTGVVLGNNKWLNNNEAVSSVQLKSAFSKKLSKPNQSNDQKYDSLNTLQDYLNFYDDNMRF